MTTLVIWIITAALVCVVGCALEDPRGMVVMFLISVLLPDELFVLSE